MECNHTIRDVGYTARAELAEIYTGCGLKQIQCEHCGLWFWPWENTPPSIVRTGARWKVDTNQVVDQELPFVTWSLHAKNGLWLGSVWEWTHDGVAGVFWRKLTKPSVWVANGTIRDAAKALVERCKPEEMTHGTVRS